MKKIPLSKTVSTTVDDDKYDLLNQWKWSLSNKYAMRGEYTKKNGKWYRKNIAMHRYLMGLKRGDGMAVDHINGNSLDNRLENLRLATREQNHQNTKLSKRNTSGYKGLNWRKDRQKWRVTIRANRKIIHVGMFDDKIDAAKAYDEAARKYHGEFAKLNFM